MATSTSTTRPVAAPATAGSAGHGPNEPTDHGGNQEEEAVEQHSHGTTVCDRRSWHCSCDGPRMTVRLPQLVWVVEPDDEVRGFIGEVAPHGAELMDDAEFLRRLGRGARPSALLIDGSCLMRLDGQRSALDGVVRTLVITGHEPTILPPEYMARPSVQFLRKPIGVGDIERGLRWLTGGADEGWADIYAASRPTR